MSTNSQLAPVADIVAIAADYEVTTNHTIPGRAIHLSIAVKAGSVQIGVPSAGNAGAVYNAGETLNLPPMNDHLYPDYEITFLTPGNVRINRVGE